MATRSFCYVDDLVEGLVRLLYSKETEPTNIGNPSEMTIRQFGDAILKVTGSQSKFVEKPLPEDDPKVRQPDISKAKRVLDGWEPKVDLMAGLERTCEYFRSKLFG